MNVQDLHSNIESSFDISSLTIIQSHAFKSSFEPESFEDFDFESAPMSFTNNDDEAIPQSSGVTSNSTAPILKEEQHWVYKDRPFRNYEIYPSRNIFLLGGRLVTSKDFRAFIAALFLLITPVVLFAVFTCPFLWEHAHPAIPIVFAYIFVLALVSMLKTSWTDPGIIPRNLYPIQRDFHDSESMFDDKEISIKGTNYSLKYCETCNIYRPPRSSHCRQCDNCVEFEDHHCMWLNNCIGKRNYRPFFTFIFASAILCLFVIVSAIYQLLYISKYQVDQPAQFNDVFSKAPVSFVLAIISFVLLWLVGGLTLFHCSLVFQGITTHEQIRAAFIKARYPELTVNPYSKRNPVKNMIQVLCQPQPKSYLRRRKMADPIIEKQ